MTGEQHMDGLGSLYKIDMTDPMTPVGDWFTLVRNWQIVACLRRSTGD